MARYEKLNAENAYIWRIVHRDNLPWILNHGLHCGNSGMQSPTWVDIGNKELIDKRSHRSVPLPPYGTLSDYVPFYQHLPVDTLIGIVCYADEIRLKIEEDLQPLGVDLNVKTMKGWYF